MVKNRILWTLLLTGSLALAATGTAQTIAQLGQSTEPQDSSSDEHSKQGQPWAIVGSWFGTTPTGLKQLITFHADGTVFRSVPGEASIDPARPPHTPTHGVWRYLGNRQFRATMWDIFYDITTLTVPIPLALGRSNSCPCEAAKSGKGALPPEGATASPEFALTALLEFGLKWSKGLEGRPARVEVRDLALRDALADPLAKMSTSIAVVDDLAAVHEVLNNLEAEATGGHRFPGLLESPGVTLDRLRAFADAAALFYKARLWDHLYE